MFEQKNYKLFSSSKILEAIKDVIWRPFFDVFTIISVFFAIFKWRRWFIQRPE